MRPGIRAVFAAGLGAALALSTSAALATAAAPVDSTGTGTHHGFDVEDMVTMHDAMAEAHDGMGMHMTQPGMDPDQMRDWMLEDAGHDQMHRNLGANQE